MIKAKTYLSSKMCLSVQSLVSLSGGNFASLVLNESKAKKAGRKGKKNEKRKTEMRKEESA